MLYQALPIIRKHAYSAAFISGSVAIVYDALKMMYGCYKNGPEKMEA
jgi:hypothetical protein